MEKIQNSSIDVEFPREWSHWNILSIHSTGMEWIEWKKLVSMLAWNFHWNF